MMKPLSCDGKLKREVTNNGYGDCPDLAKINVGRVGPGLLLEVGHVGGPVPGRELRRR